MTRITRSVATALLLAIPAVSTAQESEGVAKKTTRPSIYDAKADATEQVKAATALARRDARRVLVMFGGDWCGWCHKLHGLFASDRAIRELLAEEYVLVMVDTQAPHADALLAECRGDLEGVGYPFLAVLDGQGKVKSFLEKWAAPKVAASKVFEEALVKASSDDKLVFLHFGAPTCGWCHKLEAFLAREDIAPIMGREFVDVKLDLSRMTGAEAILKKYNPATAVGVPWFVFLDAKGDAIVTSDGPKGNIGYPATTQEIDHFIAMLRKAARKLDPAQIEKVEAALRDEARKIEAARAAPARTN